MTAKAIKPILKMHDYGYSRESAAAKMFKDYALSIRQNQQNQENMAIMKIKIFKQPYSLVRGIERIWQ